jgi:hypothetical protein
MCKYFLPFGRAQKNFFKNFAKKTSSKTVKPGKIIFWHQFLG